jgi:uncharacterized iron-regulated protein
MISLTAHTMSRRGRPGQPLRLTIIGVGALLSGAALLAGCESLAGGSSGRLVLPSDGSPERQARRVARLGGSAEVIYLGETHDNPHHHARQARILSALLADGRRPAVALEMLAAPQQAALDEALAARVAMPELERRLGWRERGWPDLSLYWPLFQLAREHGLPVLAIDLDQAVARRIARGGLASLGEERAALASRLTPDAERERRIADTIQTAHCDLMPEGRIPAMVESWHARNVTMARGLAGALERLPQVVVIVGRGHQDPGGLPAQLEALRPRTRQLIVDMLEARAGERPEEAARRANGDVVWITPGVERPDPCEDLRRRLRG